MVRAGARELPGRGERHQQQVPLLLGQIGMLGTQAADLAHQRGRPLPPTATLGCGRPRHQGGHVVTFGLELGPPQEQRAPTKLERFAGRGQTMALPEIENRQTLLRIGGITPSVVRNRQGGRNP